MIYLQELFDGWLGKGEARVILPITDPYVVHHGALGSFATVYLPDGADVGRPCSPRLRAVEGVEVALDARRRPAARFELPADRIGDLVVVSDRAQGARHRAREARPVGPDRAAALAWRAHRADGADDRQPQGRRCRPGSSLRNFDVFDVALNRVA